MEAVDSYRDQLTAYTQWLDGDALARVVSVLVANVLPQFSYEIVGLFRPSAYGLTFVSDTNSLVVPFTSPQGQHFSRMMPLLMSSTLRVLLFGVSWIIFALLVVTHAFVAWLFVLTWSSNEFLSS